MKYFTWLSVEGLRRFIVNGFQHTYCESNEKIRRMYEHVSNPIKGFLEWEEFPLKSWIGQIDTKQVLVYYNTYLREELMLPDKASKTTLRNLTTMLHENGIEVQRKNMPNGQKRSVYRFINPDDWEVYDEPNGGDNKINNTRDNKTSSSQVYNHSEDSMTTETTGLDNYADFFPDGYEQSIQDNDNFFENLADDSDDISESEVLESQIDMSDCDYVPNNTIGYESHEDYEFMDIPDEDDYFKNAKW